MLKPFISLAALGSFVLATIPLVHSGEIYNPHENFGYQSGITGGVYLKVPFNGGLKRSSNSEARVGLALKAKFPKNFSYAQSYQYSFAASNTQEIKFLDLSIGPSGFKSFKLNGMSFNEMKRIYADGDGEKDNTVLYVIGGLAIAGGIAALVVTQHCGNIGFGGNPDCQ